MPALEHFEDVAKRRGVATHARIAHLVESGGDDRASHSRGILFASGVDVGNGHVVRTGEGVGKGRRQGHRSRHSVGLKYRRYSFVAGRSGTL